MKEALELIKECYVEVWKKKKELLIPLAIISLCNFFYNEKFINNEFICSNSLLIFIIFVPANILKIFNISFNIKQKKHMKINYY